MWCLLLLHCPISFLLGRFSLSDGTSMVTTAAIERRHQQQCQRPAIWTIPRWGWPQTPHWQSTTPVLAPRSSFDASPTPDAHTLKATQAFFARSRREFFRFL